jgi:hypothetical protein
MGQGAFCPNPGVEKKLLQGKRRIKVNAGCRVVPMNDDAFSRVHGGSIERILFVH